MSARANDDWGRAVVRCCVTLLLYVLASSVPGHERTSLVYGSIDSGTVAAQLATRNSTNYHLLSSDNGSNSSHPSDPSPLAAVTVTAPSDGNHFVNRSSRDTVGEAPYDDGCDHVRANTGIVNQHPRIADDTQGNYVKFAILLPKKPSKNRDIRILSTVLPVIEMATRVVTAPGGLLQNLRIEIDYRDTQCSSTYGALGAFDIFLKRKPGDVNVCRFKGFL